MGNANDKLHQQALDALAQMRPTKSEQAARDKGAKPPNGSGGKVTRQLSRNLVPQAHAARAFQSVADFVSVYNDKNKTIDELTEKEPHGWRVTWVTHMSDGRH